MAWTYIASDHNRDPTSAATIACAESFNVATGDVLVAVARWEDNAYTATISDGGDNAFTMLDEVIGDSHVHVRVGYKINAVANASATITFTLSTAAAYRSLVVFQFRPDAGDTVATDVVGAAATGSSTAIQTATFTTAVGVDDSLVVVFGAPYFSYVLSAFQIADANATGSEVESDLAGWYTAYTSQQSNIHGQCTIATTTVWATDAIAFKSTAAGGGASSVAAIVAAHARRRRG